MLTINLKTDPAVVHLRDLKPGTDFYRLRIHPGAGVHRISNNVYTKLGYNRANKMMGWKASYTCGRDDDIGYSVELNPDTLVVTTEDMSLRFQPIGY